MRLQYNIIVFFIEFCLLFITAFGKPSQFMSNVANNGN